MIHWWLASHLSIIFCFLHRMESLYHWSDPRSRAQHRELALPLPWVLGLDVELDMLEAHRLPNGQLVKPL